MPSKPKSSKPKTDYPYEELRPSGIARVYCVGGPHNGFKLRVDWTPHAKDIPAKLYPTIDLRDHGGHYKLRFSDTTHTPYYKWYTQATPTEPAPVRCGSCGRWAPPELLIGFGNKFESCTWCLPGGWRRELQGQDVG